MYKALDVHSCGQTVDVLCCTGRRVSPNAGAQVQEKAESIQREGELAGEDGAKGDSSGE